MGAAGPRPGGFHLFGEVAPFTEMRATPFVPCPDAIPSSNPDCGPAKLVVTARGRCRRRVAGLAGMALLHDPGLCAGRIAQLVEQLTLNQRVPGSSPGAPTST